MLKKLIVSIICFGVVGILFWSVFGSLTQVGVTDFEVTDVQDISLDSFTLVGTITVDNPSMFVVDIKEITYDMIIVDTGERVGSGSFDAILLGAKETQVIPFRQQVAWSVTLDTALKMLNQEHVYLEIDGIAKVSLLGVYNTERPVKAKIDIKSLLKQQVSVMTSGFI